MYKRKLKQISLLENPEMFGGITLDGDNEWCKLAKLIPWHEFDDEYAELFPGTNGQPAISFRAALGSLLIKERYHFSDEETINHIVMNPCLQYFIGLENFTQKPPFDSSMLTRFRKRITPEMLAKVQILEGKDGTAVVAPKCSGWATDGVKWAIANGILSAEPGKEMTEPTERALVAAFLHRFCTAFKLVP